MQDGVVAEAGEISTKAKSAPKRRLAGMARNLSLNTSDGSFRMEIDQSVTLMPRFSAIS